MFRFMKPLKIPFQESLGKQLFTDIAAAWVASPSLPVGRDHGGRDGTASRKFVAKSFKLCKLNFSHFLKFNYDVFKIILYILFKVISSK